MTELEQLALCGWQDTPERHTVAATMPTFAAVGANLFAAAPTGDILLFKAWKDATGSYIPYVRQSIGDCVSHGHGHGNDLLLCVEAVLEGIRFRREDIETSTEALYGMAREAGNMLGWQDGCYGSAAVKAMTTMGVAPRSATGPYDGQKAKKWGHDGAPAEVKQKAAAFKLGGAALVSTWDELRAALGNGYPVTVCSNQGFTMQRDERGVCEARGSWGHCMLLCGIVVINGEEFAVIFQSWGPNCPTGPTPHDIPDNSFLAHKSVVSHMLAMRDSWALSKSPYFVPRPLPSHWRHSQIA